MNNLHKDRSPYFKLQMTCALCSNVCYRKLIDIVKNGHIDCCRAAIDTKHFKIDAEYYKETRVWGYKDEYRKEVTLVDKSALTESIERGYLDITDLLLEHNAIVCILDLLLAIEMENMELFKILYARGILPIKYTNVKRYYPRIRNGCKDGFIPRDSSEFMALFSLCFHLNATTFCSYIIERIKQDYPATASLELLQKAIPYAAEDSLDCLKLLCEAVGVGNAPSSSLKAASDAETVMYLLEQETPLPEDTPMFLPFHLAYSEHHTTLINKLITLSYDVNKRDRSGNTVLHLVCREGDLDTAKLLFMNYKIAIDAKNAGNKTPLRIACDIGSTELVRYLLYEGANVEGGVYFDGKKPKRSLSNSLDSCYIPLHSACYNKDMDTVNLLLENGANASSVNFCGTTPLHIACRNGSLEVVEALLAKGAKVDAKSDTRTCRRTPLQLATINNHYECIKILLRGTPKSHRGKIVYRGGAKTEYRDKDGKTALYLSIEMGAIETFRALLEGRAKCDSLDAVIKFNRVEMCRELLAKDPSLVNRDSSSGRSVLFDVTTVEMCKVLLEAGATVDVISNDSTKYTVLHHHIAAKHTDIALLLLSQCSKIDINSTDIRGATPLHVAAMVGDVDVCERLVELEADDSVTDDLGDTPLEYVTKRVHLENRDAIISILSNSG